jgi:hypothetical protein
MVSLLDEIESQVRDRKVKKDKTLLMQNAQNNNKERPQEISTSHVHPASEHRTGGISSNSVPHIKPVNTVASVQPPLTPSNHQTAGIGGFSNLTVPKSQMVIVPKDKLHPAGPNKIPAGTSLTQISANTVHAPPPKNTPVSTTKLSSEQTTGKPLQIGAYTKVGGFQQRSSSNDGPTKADAIHTQTNPLVSPRKPLADSYAYTSSTPTGAGPTSEKILKPLPKTTGVLGNPSMTSVNPSNNFGLVSKKTETSLSSGANKSSGTAISVGSKKPLNLFGLKFLSKGPSTAYGERR